MALYYAKIKFGYNKVPLFFLVYPLVQEKSGWANLKLLGEISTHDGTANYCQKIPTYRNLFYVLEAFLVSMCMCFTFKSRNFVLSAYLLLLS